MPLSPSLVERQFERLRPVPVNDLVRLGRDFDGGYVVSRRTVELADVLVGLGIKDDWSFERDFLERRPSAHLLGVDGSVSPAEFKIEALREGYNAIRRAMRGEVRDARANLAAGRVNLQVARQFRQFFTGPRRRFEKQMVTESGGSGLSWREIMGMVDAAAGSAANLFVKMDIEGAEYRILPELLPYANRIVGLAIEFHDCDLKWGALIDVMDGLLEHFEVVHVHGNNYGRLVPGTGVPELLEVSLAHRRTITPAESQLANDRVYPLPQLDMPNLSSKPDYPLTFGRTVESAQQA